MKRSGSRFPIFAQRIPADIKGKAVGLRLAIPLAETFIPHIISERAQQVRLSLRATEPGEVKRRQATIAAYLEGVWTALREDAPVSLTHRQATALAGDLYRVWADGETRARSTTMEHVPGVGWKRGHDEQHEAEMQWAAVREMWERVGEASDDLEKALGPLVGRLLLSKGIRHVDAATRSTLLSAFHAALRDAFAARERNVHGDYSPDAKAARFPEWQDGHATTAGRPVAAHSLNGLVDGWWIEAKARGLKASTHESYRNTMTSFVGYLGHDDAERVTKADVIGFKDHRLATLTRFGRPVSAKTVKDNDLAGLKAVFGWAVSNLKMAGNPAEGVTLKASKKPRKLRSKGFTDAEAVLILNAALHHQRGNEQPGTYAAKRWVPWLMAYTGARVGELAQMRSQDMRHEGGHWIVHITPEAGTVKTDEARDIALHPHLIELGFVKFVKAAPPGHLFLRPNEDDGDVLGPLQGVKNRLAEFAREMVNDVNVAPNHGWRHKFKTRAIDAGIDPRIRDAIQGHTPRTEGEDYGDVTIQAQAAAIAKMPRYVVK
jgi:integrase